MNYEPAELEAVLAVLEPPRTGPSAERRPRSVGLITVGAVVLASVSSYFVLSAFGLFV